MDMFIITKKSFLCGTSLYAKKYFSDNLLLKIQSQIFLFNI